MGDTVRCLVIVNKLVNKSNMFIKEETEENIMILVVSKVIY
jgi:hypothetical protein